MRSSHEAFCAVCSETLTQQIYQYADFVNGIDFESTDEGWNVRVDSDWPQVSLTIIADGVATGSGPASASYAISEGATDITVEVEMIADNVRSTDGRLTERFHFKITP